MDNGMACSRAKFTPVTTSATPRHLMIAAGRLSIIAFQTERESSYPGSPGNRSCPRSRVFSESRLALSIGDIATPQVCVRRELIEQVSRLRESHEGPGRENRQQKKPLQVAVPGSQSFRSRFPMLTTESSAKPIRS